MRGSSGASAAVLVGIVAAARVHLDVAEAALRQVRLERGDGLVESHVGHEPQVELRHRAVRQHGLPARPGAAGDQALDVDGGREQEPLERRAPGQIVRPALRPRAGAWRWLRCRRLAASSSNAFSAAEAGFAASAKPSIAGSPSALTSVCEGLHEVKGRAVEPRAVARVDVLLRSAAPFFAARHELELDDALGSQRNRDVALGILARRGHEDAAGTS